LEKYGQKYLSKREGDGTLKAEKTLSKKKNSMKVTAGGRRPRRINVGKS